MSNPAKLLPAPDTVEAYLSTLTVPDLKQLLALLPGGQKLHRKSDLVEALLRPLADEAGLKALWAQLDETQRLAVATTIHSLDGVFHKQAFAARYGKLPAFKTETGKSTYYSGSGTPTALRLLMYWSREGDIVPGDLRKRLAAFVAEPEPMRLEPIEALPEALDGQPLIVRCCEPEALLDLPLVLRLADTGQLKVGSSSGLPSEDTQRLLAERIGGGDFYALEPKSEKRQPWEQHIGAIKGYAWPLLLQAAGLAQAQGSRLVLSKAGQKALGAPAAEVLRAIWGKWLKGGLIDEFSRIEAIKGQRSKGRVMTAVAPRRLAITAALGHCPAGRWIKLDELSRFMQAEEDYAFDVTQNPWKLYLSESHYGSLGYEGSHAWNILQLRYLLCLLFEYAAPLGLVDVAYVAPTGARPDYAGLWGADDLEFLSRYDGLMFLRLTELGAWCLGLRERYEPPARAPSARLSVLPGLQLTVTHGSLDAEEAMILDGWAVKEADGVWRLDRQKILAAIGRGRELAELRAFLHARDEQTLPESVEALLRDCEARGRALKPVGSALLIECRDAEAAALIAAHELTQAFCLPAGECHLVVRIEHEAKFRAAVRVLGYGMTV